jgi:hypothetical protein
VDMVGGGGRRGGWVAEGGWCCVACPAICFGAQGSLDTRVVNLAFDNFKSVMSRKQTGGSELLMLVFVKRMLHSNPCKHQHLRNVTCGRPVIVNFEQDSAIAYIRSMR